MTSRRRNSSSSPDDFAVVVKRDPLLLARKHRVNFLGVLEEAGLGFLATTTTASHQTSRGKQATPDVTTSHRTSRSTQETPDVTTTSNKISRDVSDKFGKLNATRFLQRE